MLNNLVNNTDINGPSYTDNNVSCINEIFECIDKVQCQTDKNTKDLEKIKNTTDVSLSSVSSESISSNTLSSAGIEADSISTKSINISDKATVKDIEATNLSIENITSKSVSTENITGLKGLTVEGEAWVDNAHADNIEVSGNISSDSVQTNSVSTKSLDTNIISTSKVTSECVSSKCFIGDKANIQNACVGVLSTENFSSDIIDVSKLTSTSKSISMPSISTSGGIIGEGTIDVTSPVWKEIKLPLFTGTVQFYTDEWKVTITGGREFVWEDPSFEHLKFVSNDGETVTVAVDWDGEVYYTYNVAKEEPVITLVDNVGHTENNDHTFIMQNSGLPRGTVFIYQDKEYANQGIDILGKLKASNLEIACSQSMDCISIEHLHIGSSLISESPISVDICARCFCVASPCSYISNNLYTNNIESDNICNKENIHTKDLCADNVNVKCEINTTKVCSCDNITEKLYVNNCSEFHGPAYFYDNIYQCGETWCTHAQNVYTCSDTITMREGATFAGPAQIKVLKYDGTNNGVIYLGKDGTLRVGDETNCQPVLTRSEEGNLTDKHVLVWDATNKCAKDGGEAVVTCAYVNCIGKACKGASCDYTASFASLCDTCNKDWTCTLACDICTKSYNHADCVGTLCYQKACSCSINMDALCLACAKAYTDTKVDTEAACRKADDTLCLACSKAYSDTKALCACTYSASCIGTMSALCTTYAKAYSDTKALCACAFAAACAVSVVPETSTFAKCYGNSTNCVEYADKVRISTLSINAYYKIPFTSTNGTTATRGSLNIDAYPSYNPTTNVSCVYTECVASTLAVPNGNGHFRLGSYCIYIG